MNYYRLSFNPKITEAFNIFRLAVNKRYGKNSWSSDITPFYLVATSDSIQEISEYVDVSKDSSTANLPGAATLGLVISPISVSDESLPKEAKAWLTRKVESVDELSSLICNNASSKN